MNRYLAFSVLVFSFVAHADIVCRGQTSMGPATVVIAPDKVTISGAALEEPIVYHSLQERYDGHETDLITAQGLSISFQNWYGCIHNAKITANFRSSSPGFIEEITVSACSGGSTSDQICHVH